jgi:hypothetical protein
MLATKETHKHHSAAMIERLIKYQLQRMALHCHHIAFLEFALDARREPYEAINLALFDAVNNPIGYPLRALA